MKALIFLIILAAAFGFFFWRMRKAQEAADLERRKALQQRKKKDSEALNQDTEIIWPVIIKPVTGKRPPEDEAEAHEPTMTSIDFEPAEPRAAQQSGSK